MSLSHLTKISPNVTSGRFGFGRGLLAIAPVESIDAAGGIDQLLLARKERMAGRTDFHMQLALTCRTRLKSLAAGTGHCDFIVFRMNSGFHFFLILYSRHSIFLIKQPMIRS